MDEENRTDLLEIEDGGEEKKDKGSPGLALGICFGCAFGLLVCAATGDITWLPIGAAAGCGLGFAIGTTSKKGG